MAETITPVVLREETERRYLDYAKLVIHSRALPDVRDGLKPVQRRILYTMHHELHLAPEGRPAKCARIVGEVMGKYHPHGDSAIYDALVRMAQDWMMRHTLVAGQGNFGSVDGDEPAAYRYTEAKLAPLATALLEELKQNTVAMRPTYNNENNEPVVLPAQFPHLLVNGSSGIAVGLATNIPPHNLGDVVRACIFLVDNPDATVAQLLDRVKGPDFPLGGKIVTDRTTLRKIYEEGTGTIKVQGEWKIEELGRNKRQLVITSIPYGVDKGKLEADIAAIIEQRKVPQLLSFTNEMNEKDGVRIVLEIRPGTDPNLVMAYLFRHTALQETFPVNLTCLVPVPGKKEEMQPQRIGLKEALRHFLDFRIVTVRRRFEHDLAQLRRRIHLLEGFRKAFNALDEAIKLIRESSGKADAAEKLMAAFKLDEEQVEAVLDAQIYKLAQLEIKKILDELKEKKARAQEIQAILGSEARQWEIIKEELTAVAEKYGGKERRRTQIGSSEDAPEFDPEAYIVRERTNVVLTRDGWIKRVGRLTNLSATRVREGDEVAAVVPGTTVDHVVLFAEDGTAYTTRMVDVPATTGYGEPITKFFRLADQVRIVGAFTTDERFVPVGQPPENGEPAGPYVLVVTAQGQVLRTPLAPFRTASTKVGRKYVRLADGDKVVMATVVWEEGPSLMLASANGRIIHFPVDEVNILAGVGKGVMGIKLEEDDTCLGGAVMYNRRSTLTVEANDGRLMEFKRDRYEVTGRAGKGHEVVKRKSFVRVVPPPAEVVAWDKVAGGDEDEGGQLE